MHVSGKPINIVDIISGEIKERSTVAIMGGSGAGKTSLLNAFCSKAYYEKVTGDILLNGRRTSLEDHKQWHTRPI